MRTEVDGLGLLLGNAPIAKFVFGTPAKRKKVKQLKDEGWPIFEVAGVNAALPSLRDEVAKRERANVTAHQDEAA